MDAAAQSRLSQNPPLLRAEYRLVAACATTYLDPERRAQIDVLLHENLDWNVVLQTASVQRVLALGYPRLAEFGAAVPRETLDAFRGQALTTAAWNLRLAGKLLEILDRAAQTGLPVVPYKGPVLAESVYGNLALREFDDLDLVVRQADLQAIWNLLVDLGYQPSHPSLIASAAPVPGEYVFRNPKENFLVEVHTERTLRHFPLCIPPERLLADLRPARLLGREVPTFSPPNCLVFLSVHHAKDFWCRLEWVADIAELVRPENFPWDAAWDAADELGCRRMVDLALLLAHRLLQAPIPPAILARASADRAALAAARWVERRMFDPQAIKRGEQILYRMRMVPGFGRGLRYAARLATTPAADDWAVLRLPPSLHFAYGLVRPLRLFRRNS